MRKIIRQNLAFLVPYLLFFLTSVIFSVLYSKREAHLMINQCRFEFCDYFFFMATYLGDGIAAVFVTIILCFVKYRYAVFLAVSCLISSMVTQTLKHTLFSDAVRPKKFFEGIAELHLIPWVDNHYYNSFPSGHATSAFAAFFCLALILENKSLKFLMFAVALTVGFSRVYLSQHFLSDVCAGSFIGVSISLLIYHYFFRSERIKNIAWMEGAILRNK